MNTAKTHRPPPYRLLVVMLASLAVMLAAQIMFQLPKAMAAVQTTAARR